MFEIYGKVTITYDSWLRLKPRLVSGFVIERERVDFEGSGDLPDYSRCEVPVSGML